MTGGLGIASEQGDEGGQGDDRQGLAGIGTRQGDPLPARIEADGGPRQPAWIVAGGKTPDPAVQAGRPLEQPDGAAPET